MPGTLVISPLDESLSDHVIDALPASAQPIRKQARAYVIHTRVSHRGHVHTLPGLVVRTGHRWWGHLIDMRMVAWVYWSSHLTQFTHPPLCKYNRPLSLLALWSPRVHVCGEGVVQVGETLGRWYCVVQIGSSSAYQSGAHTRALLHLSLLSNKTFWSGLKIFRKRRRIIYQSMRNNEQSRNSVNQPY